VTSRLLTFSALLIFGIVAPVVNLHGCDVSDTGMSYVMPVRDFNVVFILCRLIDLIIKTTVPKIINKSTVIPTMPPTGNEDEGVIAFTVVEKLAAAIKTVVFFLAVDGESVGSVRTVSTSVKLYNK
jgi:hypothetical protein